jgi:L-amino acid N-acyltransferase YncA
MQPVVRPATPDDLPAVAAIYTHAVETSTATFDTEGWPVEAWQAKLASEHPFDRFLVAVDGHEVLGFAYSSQYRPKPAYDATRETTVYLAPAAQGRGVGRALYASLLDDLRRAGAHTAVAVLAVPNPASERLHDALGFTKVGQLHEVGHKFGEWVDVAIWQLALTTPQP